ncbi:MAG: TIGR03905 family TSCPD domain-containing protein [Clostridia bacterium]|nr:TIGR03905 family TSCPD domain-containing protein [Clostridia bacterium]
MTYRTQGVCSKAIEIELDGDIVKKVKFLGGCSGNTQGVAKLAEGRRVDEVIATLEGIRCGFKSTSCPDQLAKALKKAIAE